MYTTLGRVTISCVTILIAVVGCGFGTPLLPNTVIWQGYAAVLNQPPDLDPVWLEAVQQQYQIVRVRVTPTNVSNPSGKDYPPTPAHVHASGEPIPVTVVYIYLRAETGADDGVFLQFIQWDGSSEWWVQELGPNGPHPWKHLAGPPDHSRAP